MAYFQSDLGHKLKSTISDDPQSDTKVFGKQDTAAEDHIHYTSITVDKNGSPLRMPVHADIGKYSITSSDSNAEKACKLVMNRSADYFKQWESLCEEKMTKDQ